MKYGNKGDVTYFEGEIWQVPGMNGSSRRGEGHARGVHTSLIYDCFCNFIGISFLIGQAIFSWRFTNLGSDCHSLQLHDDVKHEDISQWSFKEGSFVRNSQGYGEFIFFTN